MRSPDEHVRWCINQNALIMPSPTNASTQRALNFVSRRVMYTFPSLHLLATSLQQHYKPKVQTPCLLQLIVASVALSLPLQEDHRNEVQMQSPAPLQILLLPNFKTKLHRPRAPSMALHDVRCSHPPQCYIVHRLLILHDQTSSATLARLCDK